MRVADDLSRSERSHDTATTTRDTQQNESRGRGFSRAVLNPSATSALTLRKVMNEQLGAVADFTLSGLMEELSAQCASVSAGNLERPEAWLVTQAQTLDALFQDLIRMAYDNMPRFDPAERLLRLAFKAQSQSRATIETLALVKNPPSATFVRQANLANGPQQVNNHGLSRPRETGIVQNELLEQTDGKRLEPSSSSGAGRSNSNVAAMAKLNGAKDR